MAEAGNRNPPKPQARQKHPHEWQGDLNPSHMSGQNIGPPSEEKVFGEPKPGQE
jgi:hypothetical protein